VSKRNDALERGDETKNLAGSGKEPTRVIYALEFLNTFALICALIHEKI
jgi:hypothetical protein